jgi:prepilin-type N-terminal cleavage/methylation domain-containing protein
MTGYPADRSTAGFTLLELVIGIMIAGMAVTAGYGALATVIDRHLAARETIESASRASTVRSALRDWIGNARLTLDEAAPTFTGLDGVELDHPNDALTLLTGGDTPLGRDVVVKLYVDHDPDTRDSGLVAQFDRSRGSTRTLLAIDARVTGLEIRYLSPGMTIGDRGWLPSWISRSILPRAVELRLTGDSLHPLLALPLLIPIEATR